MKTQPKTKKQRIAELQETNRKLIVALETVVKLAELNRPPLSDIDKIFIQHGGHPFDCVLNMAKDTAYEAKGLK